MIHDYTDRHTPFNGCFNFRDIGGYPTTDGQQVRWGRFYRAGRQDRMTSEDLAQLKKLGIKTQIDLRKADEIADQGTGPLVQQGATHHHLSVIPTGGLEKLSQLVGDTGISGKRYLGYLEFGPETWLQLFNILADAHSAPMVLHCTAGKDRTGVSTAFLLSVLGVSREIIEADYLLTNNDVDRQVAFIEQTVGLPAGMSRTDMQRAAGVPETAMHDFLNGLDERWGGALGYLQSIGLDDGTFDAVRANFLE